MCLRPSHAGTVYMQCSATDSAAVLVISNACLVSSLSAASAHLQSHSSSRQPAFTHVTCRANSRSPALLAAYLASSTLLAMLAHFHPRAHSQMRGQTHPVHHTCEEQPFGHQLFQGTVRKGESNGSTGGGLRERKATPNMPTWFPEQKMEMA